MPPPDGALVIIFDPHVTAALHAIVLALIVLCGMYLYDYIKRKLDE